METPAEVGQRICDEFDAFLASQPSNSKWCELRERLAEWFVTVDESFALEGVLWVVEHSHRYQHQDLAGYLARRRNVPLRLPIDDVIRRVAPRLNASAAEVARYLKDQFGAEKCAQAIHRLSTDGETSEMHAGLQSLRYWLHVQDVD